MKTPSEHFKSPVIGKVKTKTLNLSYVMAGKTQVKECPSAEYEVIQVLELEKGKAYVTNQWHAEHRKEPLILVDNLIDSFTRNECL